MVAQPLVKVEHVAIEFRSGRFLSKRRVRVLDDINVEIYEGETFGLVGESGSGKTTLGKTIVGLYRPAEGRVLYRGKDIWSMSKEEFREFRKQVQMIHQDPYASLNPVHTIFRILSKPLLKHKLATPDDVEEKVAQLQSGRGIGRHGIGNLTHVTRDLPPREGAVKANELQVRAIEGTRLGIPVIIHDECLHGCMAYHSTSFPQAIALANRTPCSPQTLTRAARDFAERNPSFAIEAGMAALRWLVEGYGYEITGLDVLNAYSFTMEAAKNAGCAEETLRRIRTLVSGETFGEHFVTKILGRQLELSR